MLPEDEEAAGSHAASPLPSPATAAGMTDSPAPSPPSVITDAEDPGVDAEDPELRDGPKLDLHSLRARDAALDALEATGEEAYASFQQSLQSTALLRYVFYNVESSIASSDENWMRTYAELVKEEDVRERLLTQILDERERTVRHLGKLFKRPLTERRPRFYETIKKREAPLTHLHRQQIALLDQTRSMDKVDTETTEHLLRVVNAIASGLRTTG